jgi:hypothetical protein
MNKNDFWSNSILMEELINEIHYFYEANINTIILTVL